MTGQLHDAETHVSTYCKFYFRAKPQAILNNSVCHERCSVPARFEV